MLCWCHISNIWFMLFVLKNDYEWEFLFAYQVHLNDNFEGKFCDINLYNLIFMTIFWLWRKLGKLKLNAQKGDNFRVNSKYRLNIILLTEFDVSKSQTSSYRVSSYPKKISVSNFIIWKIRYIYIYKLRWYCISNSKMMYHNFQIWICRYYVPV